MKYLKNTTTDKFQLVSGTTVSALYTDADYIDAVAATGAFAAASHEDHTVTTAATTDVLGAPGTSNIRTLKSFTARNADTAVATDVTFQRNDNGTVTELHKETLLPGYMLQYEEGVGFFLVRPGLNDLRLLTSAESSDLQRVLRSSLSAHSNI